ncbi:hypothetical protein I317_04986 [Kwoniella heveanensis CBS 569]|nr:hypothetical protein I317_04986 [Kwoniella heveanensis CBS 569]
MSDISSTYYDVLGVEESATQTENRNLGDPDAKEVFQEIQEAYETLYEPATKAAYDEKLRIMRNPDTQTRFPPPSATVYQTEAERARSHARPRFRPPPPFHPLFASSLPHQAVWLELFTSRVHEAVYTHKALHPYWRPIVERVPLHLGPSGPPPFAFNSRMHVQRAIMDMEIYMARMRWLAETKGRN